MVIRRTKANDETSKTRIFMPYHGEYRMLKAHADLATECDIPKENTFVLDNGDVLALTKDGIKRNGTVPASDVYVDGNRIGDVGSAVIKDRHIMSNDGILVVIANIDINKNELIGNTNITTRGFVLVNENGELLSRIEYMANQIIKVNLKNKKINYADLKQQIISEVYPFVLEETGRNHLYYQYSWKLRDNSKNLRFYLGRFLILIKAMF